MKLESLSGSKFEAMTNEQMSMIVGGGDCTTGGELAKSNRESTNMKNDEYYWSRMDTEHGLYINGTWNYLAKPLYACQ